MCSRANPLPPPPHGGETTAHVCEQVTPRRLALQAHECEQGPDNKNMTKVHVCEQAMSEEEGVPIRSNGRGRQPSKTNAR